MKWSKLNPRLLILLVILLLGSVTVAGFFYVRKQQMYERVRGYRPEGFAAMEQRDYRLALVRFGAYLQHFGDDSEAMYEYATARRRLPEPDGAHIRDAIGVLRRVLELEPDHPEARFDLLDLYRAVGFATETLQTADAILQRHPDHWPTAHARAVALAELRRFDEALEANRAAIELDPLRLENHTLTLRLLGQLGRAGPQITAHARTLRERHPDDPRFLLIAAIAHTMAGEDRVALGLLDQAAEHLLADESYITLLVGQLDAHGRFQDAADALRRAAEQHPLPGIRRLHAARLWQSGRIEPLLALLDGIDPRDPEADLGALALRVMALAAAGRPEHHDEAARIQAALSDRPHDPAAHAWAAFLGEVFLERSADPARVVELATEAARHSPADPHLRLVLANAYQARGESQLARQNWQEAARRAPGWSAPWVRLSRVHHAAGEVRDAVRAAEAALRRAPGSLDAAAALALALADLDPPPADADLLGLVEQIQTGTGREPRTLPLYTALLARTGQPERAVEVLERSLDPDNPLDEATLLRLAEASRAAGLGMSGPILEHSQRVHGATPTLAYFRAFEHLRDGRADAGLDAFDRARRADADAGDDPNWSLLRARYLESAGDDRAADAWIALADEHPENMTVQRAAIEARSTRDRRAFLDRAIRRLGAGSDDDAIVWRLARARWLMSGERVSEQDAADAAVLLNEVIRRSPPEAEPHRLLAACLEMLGNTSGAIEHLSRAARMRPDSSEINLRLASLLQQRGDFTDSRRHIDAALASPAVTPEQRRHAAQLIAAQGAPETAIQILRSLTRAADTPDPDAPDAAHADPAAELLLADLYRRRGQPENVLPILQRLLEPAGDAPPAPETLQFAADFFASQDDHDRAQDALDRLAALDLPPGARGFVLARHHARHGDPDRAASHYRAATDAAPDNAPLWRQRALFELERGEADRAFRVIDLALGHHPRDPGLVAARRHAALLREAADAPLLRPLLEAVISHANPDHAAAAVEALQMLIAARDEGATTDRIASRLHRLADREPHYLPLQTLTATMLTLSGDHAAADRIAARAASRFPTAAQPLALSAASLAADARWDEALAAARRWRSRTPTQPIPADLLIAEAHLRLDQPQRAIDRLGPHLEAARAAPDSHAELIGRYARALVAAGRTPDAAELLDPLLAGAPRWRAAWRTLAAEQVPDASAAADWLARLEAVTPADAFNERLALANAHAILARRVEAPEHQRVARGMILTLAGEPAAPAPVHFSRGSLAEVEGDLETAEHHYRRAIELDPDHALAKNNLAMILASRNRSLDEAIALAAAAAEAMPDSPAVLDTLAYAQTVAGRHDQALATMRAALDLDPENLLWRIHYAWTLAEAGRLEAAADRYAELRDDLPDPDQLPASVRARTDRLDSLLATP